MKSSPLTHGRVIAAWLLPLIAAAAAPGARAAVIQNDIAYIRGDQSRALFGNGTGVTIAVLDGGIDGRHPALRGSIVDAKDFSGSGTTNDDPTGVGHGTGI